MNITLQRAAAAGDAIAGELAIDGDYECVTLERTGLEIPPGRYRVTIYRSPHFNRRVPLLHGVPARSLIEIHVGNFPRDTMGCIIVGTCPIHGGVVGSGLALDDVVRLIDAAIARGEQVWITVQAANAVTVSA